MKPEVSHLAALVDARHACLRQLYTLGLRQLESIDSDDFTQLMRILAGKQRLLVELQSIDAQLKPFRDEDPQARQWPTAAERARCAQVAQQCEQLLAAIVGQEKQSEERLTATRDDAASRLQGTHTASHARGAYTSADSVACGQLDLTCEN